MIIELSKQEMRGNLQEMHGNLAFTGGNRQAPSQSRLDSSLHRREESRHSQDSEEEGSSRSSDLQCSSRSCLSHAPAVRQARLHPGRHQRAWQRQEGPEEGGFEPSRETGRGKDAVRTVCVLSASKSRGKDLQDGFHEL